MPRQPLSLLLPPEIKLAPGSADPIISGLTADSRQVAHGHLFAALPGSKVNGTDFIQAAINHGAVAVLAPSGTVLADQTVALLTHAEPRKIFSQLCASFYGKQPAHIAAVTGTNGKTSTAQFTRELWALGSHRAASMGTLGLIAPHISEGGSLTTPDTVTLHRDLAMLAENNVTHVCLEASSHGLDQYRLAGVRVKYAGFTNFTRDHLDYHGTMENYFAAKLKLFTEVLGEHGTAVLNADIPEFEKLAAACRARHNSVISYGSGNGADLCLLKRTPTPNGQVLNLHALGVNYEVLLPLIGHFQAANALCAAGLAIASGEPAGMVIENLTQLSPVRGRLELVGSLPNGAAVYVDYAHTPDGLENVLRALRPHTAGKLHCVFGCGGDRDTGKRPLMGAIAAQLADYVTITDDNPRTEKPAVIRAMILQAVPHAQEIGDRGRAIETAVASLGAGDVLVIAGKGHEQGQIVGAEVLPFDDASMARFALNLTTAKTNGTRHAL